MPILANYWPIKQNLSYIFLFMSYAECPDTGKVYNGRFFPNEIGRCRSQTWDLSDYHRGPLSLGTVWGLPVHRLSQLRVVNK